MSDNTAYTDTNRTMWNITADVHKKEGFERLLRTVSEPGYSSFDDVEKEIFSTYSLVGKDVVQLGCNTGHELLSVKLAGAGRCVGIDISDNFIEQARQLAHAAGLNVEFIRTNVYELSEDYAGCFDFVYITVGVLGWMPDLRSFFRVAHKLLRPGGLLFIYEQHPILDMFNPTPPHVMDSSYFRREPFVDEMLPEYIDTSGQGRAPSYWFPHTMADIIGGCLHHDLQLRHFAEYPYEISVTYSALEQREAGLPLSFSLVAEKLT